MQSQALATQEKANKNQGSTNNLSGVVLLTLFDHIPDEVMLLIFAYLTSEKEVRLVKQVNKKWNRVGYQRQLQIQLSILNGSMLWQYLPAMQQEDGDILGYFGGEDIVWKRNLPGLTLRKFYQRLYTRVDLHNEKKLTHNYLSNLVEIILENIRDCNSTPDAQPHKSLESFLKLPLIHQKKQEAVFNAYREIEEIFAIIRIIIRELEMRRPYSGLVAYMDSFKSPFPDKMLIKIVCDPTLNQWLTGASLIYLDNYHGKYLIEGLVKLSLKLHVDDTSSIEDLPSLDCVDRVLSKMTPTNWLDYLSEDPNGLIRYSRVAILIKAIQTNNHIVLAQLTEKVLLKMKELVDPPPHPDMRDYIDIINTRLQSLQQAGSKKKATILKGTLPQLENKSVTTSYWKTGLKIAGLVLLALIGIGLIATGVGAFANIPLWLSVTCIALGTLSLYLGSCVWFSTRKPAPKPTSSSLNEPLANGDSHQNMLTTFRTKPARAPNLIAEPKPGNTTPVTTNEQFPQISAPENEEKYPTGLRP